MRDPSHRKRNMARARVLYAKGRSTSEIARTLHLSRNTIYAYKRDDKAAGIDWDDLRDEALERSPVAPLHAIDERIAWLASFEAETREPGTGWWGDQIAKLAKARQTLEARLGDLGNALDGLEVFERWCRARCPDDEMPIMLRNVRACIADLRSGTFEPST